MAKHSNYDESRVFYEVDFDTPENPLDKPIGTGKILIANDAYSQNPDIKNEYYLWKLNVI